MKLEIAENLINILNCNIGQKTANNDLVSKILIVPSNPSKLKEYLRLYKSNNSCDGGMIKDCYRNDDVTIIFIFKSERAEIKFQNIKQFLLKKNEILCFD